MGVRIFLWLYLAFAIILGVICVAWWQREKIKKKFYELRFPERLLTINIIYPGGLFRKFYRLIPDDKIFVIDGGVYTYTDQAIMRNNDWFSYKDEKNKLVAKIDGQTYNLNTLLGIKQRWERWPELYYKEGNPWPIDFNESTPEGLEYNTKDFERLRKSDTLAQIHNAMTKQDLQAVIVGLLVMIVIGVALLSMKSFGMIK